MGEGAALQVPDNNFMHNHVSELFSYLEIKS
jgi:hypothetical protein